METYPEWQFKHLPDRGDGILQDRRDLIFIQQLGEALGLRELRAKVNYKAGIRHADLQHIRDVTRPEGEPLPNPCNDAPNRYSIWAELCYGTRSVEIVRKYLDGGALRKLVRAKFAIGIFWTTGAAYDFNLLLACAMSLGCALPEEMIFNAQAIFTKLKKAYFSYKPGTPVHYGNESFIEFSEKFDVLQNVAHKHLLFPPNQSITLDMKVYGCAKLLKIITPNGTGIFKHVLPPPDPILGLTPIYSSDLCAACGKETKDDGSALDVCTGCRDRRYCGKECQKKHWKFHKIICKWDNMDAFMDKIPLDFVGDVDIWTGAMKAVKAASPQCFE